MKLNKKSLYFQPKHNRFSLICVIHSVCYSLSFNGGSNKIVDCSPLSELNNLQELNLNVNPIKDLSPFRNLSKLIDLNIGHNKIIDLTSISNYKELASKAASTDVQIPLSCL